MGTRSRIAIKNNDGTIESIYCHWNGYPDYNGVLLIENYKNVSKIKKLIDLGDMSSLGSSLYPKTNKHSFDSPDKDVCLFYMRDRGEENTNKRTFDSLREFVSDCCKSDQEYAYLYENKKWNVASIPYNGNDLNFEPLSEVLDRNNITYKREEKEL